MYIRSAIVSLDSEDEATRRQLANRTSNPKLLARLANDTDPGVVSNVVYNRNTSAETLSRICDGLLAGKYDDYNVGALVNGLLRGTELPADKVHALWITYPSHISDWTVDSMISKNDCPEDILEAIAQNGSERNKSNLAKRQNLSDHICDILSQAREVSVRATLAKNPTISDELVEKLSHDRRKEVRTAATANPKVGTSGAENIIKNGTYKDVRGIYSSLIKSPYLCILLSMRRDLPDYMYAGICRELRGFLEKHPEALEAFKSTDQ